MKFVQVTKSLPMFGRPLMALGALLIGLAGCNDHHTVDELFAFGDTKAVRTHVDIVMAVNNKAFGTVAEGNRKFVLRAYALDADGAQVKFKAGEGSTSPDQEVTLSSEHVDLDVELEVPSSLQPSAQGYNFHFELVPAAASGASALHAPRAALERRPQRNSPAVLVLGTTRLSSICGGVIAGTPAAANPVYLSLASTLSYDLVTSVLSPATAADAVASFAAVNAVLAAHQASVEAQVSLDSKHNLQDFSAAIYLGLQDTILKQPSLQTQVIQALATTSATPKGVVPSLAQAQAVSVGFANALQTMTGNITALSSSANTGVSQVFGASAPVPSPTSPLTYAPSSISFTDTDVFATLGGTVTIVPATSSPAEVAYRVYLGGEAPTAQPWIILGSSSPGQPTQVVIAAGTAVPVGATRIWVQNLVAGQPTGPYASIALINCNSAVPDLAVVAQPGGATVSWSDVTGATSYTLYRSFGTSCDITATAFAAVSSPYIDRGLPPQTVVTYAMTYTLGGVVSQLSQQVTVTTPAAPARAVVTVKRAKYNDVELTWSPVAGATHYTVYRTDSSSSTPVVLQSNATSPYTDTTALAGHSYIYGVTASTDTTEGAPGLGEIAIPALAAPTAVCSSNTSGVVQCLDITLPPQGDHYCYYRGSSLPLDESNFITTGFYSSFADTGLTDGSVLYYAFRTVDSQGNLSVLSEPLPTLPGGVYLTTHQPAAVVIGQQDFSANIMNELAANRFYSGVSGMAADSAGALYIADSSANRVLGFNFIPTILTNSSADFVLGQPDFASSGSSTLVDGLQNPTGVAWGQGNGNSYLFVADNRNRRVLIYPAANTLSTHASAILSIGSVDPDHEGGLSAPDATTLASATDVSVGGGKIAIADTAGNRVLLYNQFPTSNNAPADLVVGQPNMTGTDANAEGVNEYSLSSPSGVWTDGTRLVIYDYGNARVLIYKTFPTSNQAAADIVIGQPTMFTNISNGGDGIDSSTLAGGPPEGPKPGLSSNGVQLAIADYGNNRVLVFNSFPTSNYQHADVVLGQPDGFTVSQEAPSQNSLYNPTHVMLWGTHRLIVSDMGNNRALIY